MSEPATVHPIFVVPAQVEPGVPTIHLNGQDWPVPLFAPKQNRLIVPAITRLRGVAREGGLTEAQYDDLLLIVYTALTRAHPLIRRIAFDEWPLPTDELMGCFDVIAQQTGLMKKEPIEPGEA